MRIHSFLSPKCRVGKSKIMGRGVIAKKGIKKNELIAVWGGTIYSDKELKKISKNFPHFASHPFGVCSGFYMGPNSPNDPLDDAEMFNHSCDPNAGIKGQIILLARRKIKPGEEVCFDYETVEDTPNGLSFTCACGSKKCRGFIDGSAWKNKKFQKENFEFFSWYLQSKIKKFHGVK